MFALPLVLASMATRLPNYLRMYRKRASFSQDEVAFLLGSESGTRVSRYEHFGRHPTLETVFAYEAIFRTPAKDLFAGTFQRAEKSIRKRAQVLTRKLSAAKTDPKTLHKLHLLQTLSSGSALGSTTRL